MTRNKARKQLVRQRSAKTGESYTAALRQLLTNKENSVSTTPTTDDTALLCTLCGEGPGASKRLLVAGSAPICRECDERFRTVFRSHLEPVAEAAGSPLDQFMSAIAYAVENDRWVVHLHTFRPGPVIGPKGATVQPLRDALVEFTGDAELRLNLVSHEPRGCSQKPDGPSSQH